MTITTVGEIRPLLLRIKKLESNQRTPGTVEICSICHAPIYDAVSKCRGPFLQKTKLAGCPIVRE